MSLNLNANKQKTKSTNTESSTRTTTPVLPDWLSNAVQGSVERIDSFKNIDPLSLENPASALENRAAAMAGSLTGSPWNFDRAADVMRAATASPAHQGEAQSVLTNLESYYNPYRQQVTDAAMADFDADAGRTRAAQDLQLAGAGAFGGSGAALTKSLTEGELARARSTQLSGLLSNMFTTSAGLSAGDADRRQSASFENARLQGEADDRRMRAAEGLAGLSAAFDANNRANITTQAELGAKQRGLENARALAPVTQQKELESLLTGLPLELFRGETTSGTSTSTGTSKTSGFGFGLDANFNKIAAML
jgi:hypothetical protein